MKKGSKKRSITAADLPKPRTKNVVTALVKRPEPAEEPCHCEHTFGVIEAFASTALNGLIVANAKDYDGSEAARKALVDESWALATMMTIESLTRSKAGTTDDRQLPLPLEKQP